MPLNGGSNVAIAVCPRCHFKRQFTDLRKDPNDGNWYCKFDCIDIFDPWRLPPRRTENISLDHARPEPLPTPVEEGYPYPANTQTEVNGL